MFKPKSKKPFPVEHIYMPVIKTDKVNAIQMVLRNFTERKKIKLELLKSENRF